MKIRASDKPRMKMTGVYVIVNRVNGKKYVGSSANSFMRRMNMHFSQLKKNKHHSIHLQRDWNKDGEESFEFRILETTTPKFAVAVEQTVIDAWKTADRQFGYNINPTAGSMLGMTRSAETKALLSLVSGRPKMPDGDTKSMYVRARLTHEELAEIDRRAKAANAINRSDWIRQRILGE